MECYTSDYCWFTQFVVIKLAWVVIGKGRGKSVHTHLWTWKKQGTSWQQCCPRISYRPAPAGNLWYSSLTSSCLAFPLSTLCLRISAISIHHSSNLQLSRSTSSWRKAIQNRKDKKITLACFQTHRTMPTSELYQILARILVATSSWWQSKTGNSH